MNALLALARALLLATVLGGLAYAGAYWLDNAAWSHVLDFGSSSLWATIAGGTAFAFTFVNEFWFDGEIGGGYQKAY